MPPGSSWDDPGSVLELHCTHSLMNLVLFLHPLNSVILLSWHLHLSAPFVASRSSARSSGRPPWRYFATPLLHCYLVGMSFHAFDGLVAEIAPRERVPLLDVSFMSALCNSFWCFVGWLHPDAMPSFQLELLYSMSWPVYWGDNRLDPCSNIHFTWSYHACQFSFTISVNFFPCPMQIEPPADCTSAPLPMSQCSKQADQIKQ